ncbi:hypothetical protein [Kineococcus aurantiacus]|uniref:Uncharacterized protein n=1 Tax=Kineococcus aurantiacus TaxID=37633 RepID=A0A7Y9DJK7_9ACTN|nr:hypothetical protein [Kineococcus aurantiacus]NYD21073.1 hypothetical protein [Kineococcus aurantiacus]
MPATPGLKVRFPRADDLRVSQDQRQDQPTSSLDGLHPAEGEDLGWAPRRAAAGSAPTATSAAFGAVEVGAPVSRLAAPVAPAPAAPVPAPVARPDRCPSCGARARAEEDWCSLCHTSLLPAPAARATSVISVTPETPVAAGPAADRAAVRVLEDEDGQLALDLQAPARQPTLDEAEVARMLGALSSSQRTGPRGLGSPRAKALVAAGGALGLTALLLGGGTLLGSLLG